MGTRPRLDVARDGRESRRRERPASASRAGGPKALDIPGGGKDVLPDPLEIGGRDFLVARGVTPEFATRLLRAIPGAVLIPWDIPSGSVLFARCPQRGFARKLQERCKRGHSLLDESNVYRPAAMPTVRVCRACARWRQKSRRQSA